MELQAKILQEYRCPDCHKLLCKGVLTGKDSEVEVKCRGCGRPIARGELRFGERLPNAFAEGEMTVWFHPGFL